MVDRLIVHCLSSPSLLATKATNFSSRRASLKGNYIDIFINLSTRRYSFSYTYIACFTRWGRNLKQQLRVTLWFINCSVSWNVILILTVLRFMNTTKVLRHQLSISRLNNRKRFGLVVRHFIDARSKREPKCVPQLFLGLLLGIVTSYRPIIMISLTFETIPEVFAIVNSRC